MNKELVALAIVKQVQDITGHKVEVKRDPLDRMHTFTIHSMPVVHVEMTDMELKTKPLDYIVSDIIRHARSVGMVPNFAREREIDPDLEKRFTYHSPKPGQPDQYKRLRDAAKELAYLIRQECGVNREASTALTNLEQAVFWANAAIARNG